MEIEHVSTEPPQRIMPRPMAGVVNEICWSYTGGVINHGSGVMTQPKVVPIYWGSMVQGNAALKLAFDEFYAEVLNSDYVDRLAQYGVGQPLILPSHVIADDGLEIIDGGVVGRNLAGWFANKTIPLPDPLSDAPNWCYIILAPPDVEIGGVGYHSSSVLKVDGMPLNVVWGLVASYSSPGETKTNVGVVNSVCNGLAHEMVEAFTNPHGAGWSVDVPASKGIAGQNCEIGDICNAKVTKVGRWGMQPYWSNQDKSCVGTFPPDWQMLGSLLRPVSFLGSPVAAINKDGRLEVFAVTPDGNLWHALENPPAPTGSWSAWTPVLSNNPRLSAPPVPGYNADGQLEVFGLQSGGIPWHVGQTAVGGPWSDGATFGGALIGTVCVANDQHGAMHVFGIGTDHHLYEISQGAPNSGWGGWASLGAPTPGIGFGDPRATRNKDGRLEVFVLASDQRIWHLWQLTPNGGWSGWASLGGPTVQIANGAPFVGANADGRIEVFATGVDGAIYHIWQIAPSNGWSSWEQLQAALPGVQFCGLGTVANNQDGRFQLLFIGSDGALWTLAQSVPSGVWKAVRFLDAISTSEGTPPQAMNADQRPAAILGADGILHVFVASLDGSVWELKQVSAGGNWGELVTS